MESRSETNIQDTQNNTSTIKSYDDYKDKYEKQSGYIDKKRLVNVFHVKAQNDTKNLVAKFKPLAQKQYIDKEIQDF